MDHSLHSVEHTLYGIMRSHPLIIAPPPTLLPQSYSHTQVQRMEHALRSVEHTLYGMRKPRRLDRASLDLVSISQLQAAVDNFAAVGEGGLALGGDTM